MDEPKKTIGLAIVCPMANERATAVRFVREVLERCVGVRDARMFVVLDRASTDGTRELLDGLAKTEPRLTIVWAPENRNVVDAYVCGYRAALDGTYDWILEIDAGYSHSPDDIPRFLDATDDAMLDCAFGSRFCRGGRIERSSWRRRLLSFLGTKATNALLGTKLQDMTSGFQLFRRDALSRVLDAGIASRGHFFQTEMKYHCREMRVREIPITYRAASPSVSRASIVDALSNLIRLRGEAR